MTVRVQLPSLFADRIDGISSVEVSATTVDGAMRAPADRYPELRSLILGTAGEMNPVMVLFLNDAQLLPEQWQTRVSPGDELQIVPAIEGG